MIRKEPKLCHTERSEVSHNTESKRDFSHSLKMTKGKQLSMTTAYKPSGIEWLGEIPKHWEIVKFKYIFKERSIKGFGHEQQLASTQNYGVIPKSLYPTRTVEALTSDLNFFKLVRKNNFVISLRSFEGGIEYSQYQGIISPAYTILESTNNIEHSYFQFLFKSSIFISALQIYKTGIREGQNISYLELQQDFLPLPPLQEQKAIAEFLDKKCDKISQFIESKQKLITLLQEKKQALINEAVCGRVACHTEPLGEVSHNAESTTESKKDFSPTAQNDKKGVFYKPSGIEYLGLIPHHWEVRKLKYIVFSRNQRKDDKDFKIGLENIESKTGKYIPTNENVFEDSGISFYKNDILFGKLRPYLAKVFLADRDGICVSEFLVLESKEAYSNFLKFLMLSSSFIDIIDSSTYGTKMPRTSWEFVGNLKIPLPPLQEQKEIAEFLDTQITKIDLAIEKTKQQITYIKEYKTSLINQAVCGRIQLKD